MHIDVTKGPNNTFILTPDAEALTAISKISAVRSPGFWEHWLNAAFAKVLTRVKRVNSDGVRAKFESKPEAVQQQIMALLNS